MDVSEKAMETLDTGFDDAMAVYMLPEEMRVSLRTSNMVERLNGELKRRSDVIKISRMLLQSLGLWARYP